MIELFEQNIKSTDRQSSKGNQLKWKNDKIWYKADFTGYEGLAEYMISHLLEYSSLEEEEFVKYDYEQIKYKHTIYNGVQSTDFLTEGWEIITLERLFQTFFQQSIYKSVWHIQSSVEERFRFLVSQVERVTNLKKFGVYLNKIFTIDAMFLNEDRHMHNIAVLMNTDGKFDYCPMFDHGAGLLADTSMDYPLDVDIYDLIPTVKAKTISTDFDEQLDISEALCGNHLQFYFDKKDVDKLLNGITGYSQQEKNRVRDIIFNQMRKYAYLFKKK